MKPAYALAVFLLLAMLTSTANAASEPNIKKFDPGKYVMGPKFNGKTLKNKVIVVEYWGITCKPCHKAIPHTTELAKKYGHDKVCIIANETWNGGVRRTAEVWKKHAKNNLVMVTTGGKMPGFNPSGVPAAVIFDHNLKPVWTGHPGSMDKALADAVAKLPSPKKPEEKPDKKDGKTDKPATKDFTYGLHARKGVEREHNI